MSNINTAAAWHGLDDEPDEREVNGKLIRSNKCRVCWPQAKTKFFAKKWHPKGETLNSVYAAIHDEAHQY